MCFVTAIMGCFLTGYNPRLGLDDWPIFHCVKKTYGVERFPTFVTFVNNVLQAHQSEYLSRFKLGVGPDYYTRYTRCNVSVGGCKTKCLPDLRSAQVNAWIAFPLTRFGLRELDLRIHFRKQGHAQLPVEIFLCETLEVLKLDVNLGFDQVKSIASFRLPNLKKLHLSASLISELGFITRLVSSCPLLEDLTLIILLNHVHVLSISSLSLRRLCLRISTFEHSDNPDFVHIHAPNLEYLQYYDNLALKYSITTAPHLVKAEVDFLFQLMDEPTEVSYQQMICLIKPLANVEQFILNGLFTMELNEVQVKYDLPVFINLKYLELGYYGSGFWDNILLAFLSHSPVLETLVFPKGMISSYDLEGYERCKVPLELERELCKSAMETIPWCCKFHVKKIVIGKCFGKPREVEWIGFLLRHTLVLEELVICCNKNNFYPVAEEMALENTLNNLPRASVTCSIKVQ